MSPLRRFFVALAVMISLILIGTFGFIFLENMDILEALYMTVITLSTVGFGETHPLHESGRLFVIVLIVSGVMSATFMASALGQMILEGEIKKLMGRKKMDSRIKKLSGHKIIAGFGRVGRQVAQEFSRRKVSFVIIENDDETLEYIQTTNYYYLAGEATEDEVLLRAGVERADVLVSTLPSEADNVYLALTAHAINSNLHIIARADNPGGEKKLLRAGASSVVSPHVLGGMRMAMSSLRPNVVDFMQMTSLGDADLGIEEISIPEGSKFAGKTLIDSNFKSEYGTTVIGIKKPGQTLEINPPPNSFLNENDILVLVGSNKELERLTTEMG